MLVGENGFFVGAKRVQVGDRYGNDTGQNGTGGTIGGVPGGVDHDG